MFCRLIFCGGKGKCIVKKAYEIKAHILDFVNLLPMMEKEHMRRVGTLTGLLSKKAHEAGIYKGDAVWDGYKDFGKAACYHDIGKAWVPRKLLMKNGVLTKEEERILELHPVHAKIMFEEIKDSVVSGIPEHLLHPALQAAEFHHERWDGRGYPYRLAATEIPLIARITAICDVYDTITSKRVYKEALNHDIACRELRINAGTQFDPLIADVFIKNEDAFARLKRSNEFAP